MPPAVISRKFACSHATRRRQEPRDPKDAGIFQLLWLADGAHIALSGLEGATRRLLVLPRLGGDSRELPYSGAYLARAPGGTDLALASWGAGTFRIITVEGAERGISRCPW
jgi:hypothetical protein